MSSGFTNTFILEANRLSSEQVKSGNNTNNALFTNKINDGLKLNTGDVVGVHSAYISELGAEGSDIEIKGKELDKLNASQILSYNEIINTAFEGSAANHSWLNPRSDIVNRYPLSRREEVNESIVYRDDEINMVMTPYKNANGEYYIPLPYRYAQTLYGGFGEGIREQIFLWNTPQPIVGLDNSLTGSASKTFGNASIGNLTRMPRSQGFNLADVREYYPKPSTPNGSLNLCIRHDNSRYAIYQLKNCIHLYPLEEYITYPVINFEYLNVRNNALKGILWKYDSETNTSHSISNASYELGLTEDGHYGNEYWRDIAPREYVRVRNKVNCSVTAGYNSNTDIANKITEDMKRTENIESIGFDDVQFSIKAENQLNKLYNTATVGTYDNFSYEFFNDIAVPQGDQDRFYYIEAHETIGVKRPELYDLGRAFATKSEGYQLSETYFSSASDVSENLDGLIYTSIPWSKVKDLKNLVDAQHRYPELFNTDLMPASSGLSSTTYLYPNASIGRSGFLHINTNASHKFLGYDLSDNASTYWSTTIPEIATGVCPNNEFCSVPFFFDINASTSELSEGIKATGQNWANAVYGFAVKYKDNLGNYFIALQSSSHYELGGYTDDDMKIIPKGTKIGWDYHFNAYGCPCMLMWNGLCGLDGVAYEGMGLSMYTDNESGAGVTNFKFSADKFNQIYLGSPDTEIKFDDESDRFEILKLHTSEKIGNLYNAGYQAEAIYTQDENASATPPVAAFQNPDGAVPENNNAETKVYKINKQLTKTNFTPAMAPYLNEVNASFFTSTTEPNASYTAKQIFEYPNNNFVQEAIFDSTCGNYIVDWGMNEKYWNESLWGVMGFRYSQTDGKGNSQTRVTNSVSWGDTVDGMDLNTTNADITNADFDDMTRNMFNVKTFGLTPPIPQTPRFEVGQGNACHTFAPPINITQVNGQPLRALEIPTRTLRPYYTIRSNITGQANYFGSSQSSIPLPVVAIVEKVSQSGDFFNLSQGRLQFTITQPTMLTDITTSVHDPDGSYSKVSPNSAVLYQVERKVNADMNVVSTILQGDNKKQAQQFQEELEPPQPTKKDINNVIKGMME